MKDQGTWSKDQRPLLDEYVHALKAAAATRDAFGWLDRLEDNPDLTDEAWRILAQIASGLPTQWDRHTKRAAALADQLALTPRGQKAVGLVEADDRPADPFARFTGDELEAKRKARGGSSVA